MDIAMGVEIIQLLNYDGIPFHYCRCHKYGHLVKECEMPLSKKALVSKSENQVLGELEMEYDPSSTKLYPETKGYEYKNGYKLSM